MKPCIPKRPACWLAAILLSSTPAAAVVEGTVTNPHGAPVEGALVAVEPPPASGPQVRSTDAGGRFAFPDAAGPATLRVEHPRFLEIRVEVPADGSLPAIVLEPKQEIYEEIVVSASRDADAGFQPVSVATASVSPIDRPDPVSNVVELVEAVPGVAESGQGGHFQAYSIRGIAGQRVMTLVSGARIVTERRAGASASFIDPLLLGRADVVRGPFSSYYGSGALGGLIQLFPRRWDGTSWRVGYDSQGGAAYQQVGLGGDDWSLGIAHRRGDDAETPDGERIFDRFEQWSATLSRTWSVGAASRLELVAIPAFGRDIGKPNTGFPEETTLYPEDNHLVTRLTAHVGDRWRFDTWAHPNELITRDLEPDARNVVDNDAFDYGLGAQRELDLPNGFAGRVGIDYLGRRGVTASERSEDLRTGAVETTTTLDGGQDELGLYGSLRRSVGRATVEGGGRLTWIRQENRGAETAEDETATAFVGLTAPLGGGFELAANVGTGFRFPGLSERFFSGTTGRGDVVANADLDPERSLGFDVGVRYFGERLYAAAYAYRNEIDDYIERIETAPGVRTFVNRTSGTIRGVEIEGFYQLTDAVRLKWGGQRSAGEDDTGADLGDIPPHRIELGADVELGSWGVSGRWQHRLEKDEIGSGEQPTPAAEIVSLGVDYRLANGLVLHATATNLLDETYLPSADDLAVPAPGRSLGFGVGWGE